VAKWSPVSAAAEHLLQSVAPDTASLDRYGSVDVERRSLTLFPVLPKTEVVFDGQTVEDTTIYCIEVE